MRKQAPTYERKVFPIHNILNINSRLYDCRVAFARVVDENTAQRHTKILPKRKTNKGRRNWINSKLEQISLD